MYSFSKNNFSDLVKSKIPLSSLFASYTKLQKRGKNYVGCCPFHKEKTASFYVYEEEGNYHCYGCKAHGDAFTLLMEKKGLSFLEALQELAAQCGLQMPVFNKEQDKDRAKIDNYYKILTITTQFYCKKLKDFAGKLAMQYLLNRKINSASIAKFQIGYADNDNSLLKYLLNKDFELQDLEILGLIKKSTKNERHYDYFRNRLIFPIFDSVDRVIGFGGRILGTGEPKYLNSPTTPLYNKGDIIYGYNFARKVLDTEQQLNHVICCEGYIDVISLSQNDFIKSVAPLGTALTQTQLNLLWKLSPEPILSFDGDNAGEKAAIRAMEMIMPLLKCGHSVKFADMPQGEDPDSLLQTSDGKGKLQKIYTNAQKLSDKLWEHLVSNSEISSPEQKSLFRKKIYEAIAVIQDENVRREYRVEFKTRTEDFFRLLYKNRELSYPLYKANHPVQNFKIDAPQRQIELLLACILNNPDILTVLEQELTDLDIANEQLLRLRDAMVNFLFDEKESSCSLQEYLVKENIAVIGELICRYDNYIHAGFIKAVPCENCKEYEKIITKWRELHSLYMQRNQKMEILKYAQKIFTEDPSVTNQELLYKAQQEIYTK